jgi:5-deoxy-glucuronate isomerase
VTRSLPAGSLHRPAGTDAADGWSHVITPETAGWAFAGLRIARLGAGERIEFATGIDEAIVVPLSGSARVACGGDAFELHGRQDVFAGPTDFAYLPPGASVALESPDGGRFAVATARAERAYPFRYGPLSAVPIEHRGGGAALREVRNFASATAFEADRLMAVEVITPGGNWSSYPPHKHDEDAPGEAVLEEIYYYEIAGGPLGPGLGYQRVYGTPDRPVDLLVEVRDQDVVLVPHGWHGPSMAAPGYDMYYLNVMAGPGAERAWRVTFDPAHAWVRDTWTTSGVEPPRAGDAPRSAR